MGKLAVSVVVSAYNEENSIENCIKSLMEQSLEDLEIILIDHGSADKTWEIIQKYAKRDVRIVAYKIAHEGTLGRGRNFGIEHAKGEYIGFCDADDFMDCRAFEMMYRKAEEDNCDIVCAPMYEVSGDRLKLTRVMPDPTIETMLMGSMSLCNKIIKKSLFMQCVKMRDDIYYEDVSICPIVISYANKIGYIDLPVYYYVIRDQSMTHSNKFVKCLDYIEASKYAIMHCNHKYTDRLVASFALVSMRYADKYWTISQAFRQYTHDLYCEYPRAADYIEDKKLRNQFKEWGEKSTFIPPIVYLNGLTKEIDEEYVTYLENNVFYKKCKIIILKKENCNMDSFAESLYEKKNYEILGIYLGIKYISESGGFYLSSKVKMKGFLSAITHYDVVLGMDENRIMLGGKSDVLMFIELQKWLKNNDLLLMKNIEELMIDFICSRYVWNKQESSVLLNDNDKMYVLSKDGHKIFQWI